MKALITGVSGFVGTLLSEKLIENGYEVSGFSRRATSHKNIEYYPCDITDSSNVEEIIRKIQPDEIYHLAGSSFIPSSYTNTMQTYDTIVNGTLVLYEAIRKLDIDCKVLFVGSGEVYGEDKRSSYNEGDLLQPSNPYAGAKASADLISEQYFKTFGMRIIRARPFNHTGPKQSPHFVCSNFAKQISEMEVNGDNCISVGNINVQRDFLDVRDVVNAYLKLMKYGENGEAYNVSSNKPVFISELLNMLLSTSSLKDPIIEIEAVRLRVKDVAIKAGDNTKLRLHTGWKPEIQLLETMKDLLDYWRDYQAQVGDDKDEYPRT
ncbi:hypothetical protein BBD42_01960 [Paenibacillus sp. BIHB 4019]|uniref:NAD(P)-binding domain-containing protein n=1 Tax=Paenibacillus sp. BIHB 4019 TaxID=1870819 RepID=A0A1B2DCD7_9BACL|nr:GDP-mannose 4,6-dehydratase [Paenibacillus sp. BIHB 4019]ANY65371.1 hypothetical protein BBD42_01960 [Paenibacillus sp. BIHB 4019]